MPTTPDWAYHNPPWETSDEINQAWLNYWRGLKPRPAANTYFSGYPIQKTKYKEPTTSLDINQDWMNYWNSPGSTRPPANTYYDPQRVYQAMKPAWQEPITSPAINQQWMNYWNEMGSQPAANTYFSETPYIAPVRRTETSADINRQWMSYWNNKGARPADNTYYDPNAK